MVSVPPFLTLETGEYSARLTGRNALMSEIKLASQLRHVVLTKGVAAAEINPLAIHYWAAFTAPYRSTLAGRQNGHKLSIFEQYVNTGSTGAVGHVEGTLPAVRDRCTRFDWDS